MVAVVVAAAAAVVVVVVSEVHEHERLEGLEGRQECMNEGKLSLRTIKASKHEGSSSFTLHCIMKEEWQEILHLHN